MLQEKPQFTLYLVHWKVKMLVGFPSTMEVFQVNLVSISWLLLLLEIRIPIMAMRSAPFLSLNDPYLLRRLCLVVAIILIVLDFQQYHSLFEDCLGFLCSAFLGSIQIINYRYFLFFDWLFSGFCLVSIIFQLLIRS